MRLLLQNLRYAIRLWRRQPAFTCVAMLTLALGIGASTAVFTVVYGVLLRPLPYRDPARLVMVLYGHKGQVSPWLSPPNFRDYVARNPAFASAAAIAPITANLTGAGDPERLQGARVSRNFFEHLGVRLTQGRGFAENDGRGDGGEVVLSQGLWQRRFGGRPDVIDSTVSLDGQTVTIVGVASADLNVPATAEFWQPLVFTPRELSDASRGAQWVQALARVDAGSSLTQATTAMEIIGARLTSAYASTEADVTLRAVPLHERIAGDSRPTLMLLLAAVVLVMVIACANVASLLLARAQGRQREVAVRVAMGASGRQVIAQLLTESLLLGTLGALAGVALAALLVRALVLFGPASIPRLSSLTMHVPVLLFAAGAALATSLAFGLAPMLAVSRRIDHHAALQGARGSVGASATGTRRLLVVFELALAAMLLVGAGLLGRSYLRLQLVEPGFTPDGVITFALSLPTPQYPTAEHLESFVSTLLARVNAEPGVTAASVAMGLPFTSGLNAITGFRRADQPEPESASMPSASLRIVSANYFRTMEIPLRAGRLFDDHDTGAGPDVVLINQRAAHRYFADVDPIGQQIVISAQLSRDARSGPKTVVGVVGDVKYGGLDEETPAELYVPYAQEHVDAFTVAVRTTVDPSSVVPVLRRQVGALDARLPLANVKPLAALVDASMSGRRFVLLVFLAFAAVAATLAVVGVYGVLAYLVGQRRKEIAVRLAIGASPSQVRWLFVREGVALAVVGLVVGLASALAVGRFMRTLLFEVTASDPETFVIVAAVLTAAALCATYGPASRAAGLEPADVLNAD